MPGEGGTAAGTFLAAGSGADTAAQFTYDKQVTDNDGESGTWSFFTTAAGPGSISEPWRWTGLHAWFNVTARLDAVVIRGGVLNSTTNLVNTGPEVCCTSPSNGFDYSGTANFSVQTGDVYGFVLRGSNGDFNDLLRGELTVGEVPESCADAQNLYHPFIPGDGRYVIHPAGGQRFSVYCADMVNLFNGKDYLEVRSGPGLNYGQYAAGGAAAGTTVTTSYTKIRLDPANLTVDINDTLFASSTGSLNHPDGGLGNPLVTEMPYATAMGCDGTDNGTANIDLQGTPFAVDDPFQTDDPGIGGATFSALDQVVDLTGGGFCGWTQPTGGDFNPFNPDSLPSNFALDLRYLNAPAVELETPVLFSSIARSGNAADLYALVEGASSIPVTVDVHKSASCTNGLLDSPSFVASKTATTDADGYVVFDGVSPIASGQFVTVTVTSPAGSVTPAPSNCIRTTADNDSWPKALGLQFASPATVQDVIESDGRARWYRFQIFPNQRITINVSGLSSDYDLAVFRDIAAEFESQLVPQTAADVTKLSAEFAPSVFSPSVFSPSVFSPSVFSPDAYAPSVFSPSVFSPSVFSPSVFSPSVFSPSVFSPSVFSPSVFSPSVFSPSVFSPSVFSPSVFSPSVFSPTEIQQAFSSAQTRSLIGVSATPGTGDETVVVNSWNETGEFYVRVAGRGGAFDPSNLFTLTVTPSGSECTGVTDTVLTPRPAAGDAGQYATVIVTDSSRLPLGNGSDGTLADRIADLSARPEVDGILIDVADDVRVQELRDQADAAANRGCPFAQNLVAEEIKSIVDSYRTRAANPTAATEALRYVTILGDDTVVPFFRSPDQSLLGQESGYFPPAKSDSISEASLRRDYVLSQDAYGSGVQVDIRTSAFPIPDLAVGRLVESPSEIVGMIDAYIDADGVVTPDSGLVTGYDFLTDAADAVVDELDPSLTSIHELITDADVSPQQLQQPGMTDPRTWSWDAEDLRTELLGERHDLVYLAGHFSANSALAADYQTQVVTSELTASSVDLENSIVISGGCHAGYNLVDGDALAGVALPLDWAQAFAQKGAVLVAGTGYQYGDTDFLEYSERLYRDFTHELRAGAPGTPVSIGEALAAAKRTYIATTQDIRGIHEKAVLEATLFGLPMFGVDFATGRTGTPSGNGGVTPTPVAGGPAGTLGLATHDLNVVSDLTPRAQDLDVIGSGGTVTGSVTATWLEGPDGVVTNPAEPALPKDIVNVSATNDDLVLRGVGFRGGTYSDESNVLPLSGAPTTELRGVHAPFVSPVFYPMRTWTANYFGELGGSGGTNLIVTPVQHRSDPAHANRSIRRAFEDLDLRLFYLDTPTFLAAEGGDFAGAALADAPTIVDVSATADGSDLVFSARVIGDPSAAIHEVWVVYTTGSGDWLPLDLEQCTGAALPASCAGLDDSRVWTARLTNAPASIQYVVQAANGTGLVTFDDNRGQYYLGSTTPAPAAVATSMALIGAPTSGTFGQTVNVTAKLTLTAGGAAVAGKPVLIQIGGSAALGLTGGDGKVTVPISLNSTPGATGITATFGGDATHVTSSAEAAFSIAKAPTNLTAISPFATITDADHVGTLTTLTATLGSTTQPLMNRTVTVTVSGPVSKTLSLITDYLGRVRLPLDLPAGSYAITVSFAGDETYQSASRSGTTSFVDLTFLSPVDNPPTVNVVKAGNTVPIKFSLGGNFGLGILDGTPIAVPYDCESGVPTDPVEETSTANSGLVFVNGVYQYNWKSPKSARGCFTFQLALDDGTVHIALFQLR